MRKLIERTGTVFLNVFLTSIVILTVIGFVATADEPCGPPPYPVDPTAETACFNGDINGDDALDIGDAVGLLSYLFVPGSPPPLAIAQAGCDEYSDCFVDEGQVDSVISDMIVAGAVGEGHLSFDPATQAELDDLLDAYLADVQSWTQLTATMSSDFSLGTGISIPIPFNQVEDDPLGEFDPSTWTFTAAESGLYQVIVHVTYESVPIGGTYASYIIANGTTATFDYAQTGGTSGGVTSKSTKVVSLPVGGTVSANAYRNIPGGHIDSGKTYLQIIRLR